ncbi:MAG: hypothetical protein LBR74_10255 [Eubacterium sp.]|jgi:cell division protein FtsL|nr:hypothetical protein [Eubacterium sp.]
MYLPHNSNLAYDFNMFDTEEADKRREAKEKQKSKIGIVKQAVARKGNFFKILIAAAAIVAIPGYIIMSKAEVSLLSAKINEEMMLLEEAKATNERLQSELDNLYTLQKVEEFAISELGLEKIKASQEVHAMLNIGRLSEVVREEPSNPFVTAEVWFNEILEYLGFR